MIDWLLVAYVELFRCTPLLVQIIWFYYALPVVLGINIPATPLGVGCRARKSTSACGSVHLLAGIRSVVGTLSNPIPATRLLNGK